MQPSNRIGYLMELKTNRMKKLLISLVAMMAMGCGKHYMKDGKCYSIYTDCKKGYFMGKMYICEEYVSDTLLVPQYECKF